MHPKKPELLELQGGVCGYCGIELDLSGDFDKVKATIDHIVPKSKIRKVIENKAGGLSRADRKKLYMAIIDMTENLMACCESCNAIKADLPLAQFLAKVLKTRHDHWRGIDHPTLTYEGD